MESVSFLVKEIDLLYSRSIVLPCYDVRHNVRVCSVCYILLLMHRAAMLPNILTANDQSALIYQSNLSIRAYATERDMGHATPSPTFVQSIFFPFKKRENQI